MLAGAILMGCGGGAGESRTTQTIACTFTDDRCDSLTAQLTAAESTALQTGCGQDGGIVGAACSTVGALSGRCQYAGAAAVAYGIPYPGATLDEYFYAASWTLTSAQDYCALAPAGVWVP
jgi:hypothetical protein